ncbi:MAG: F0F1 ATP synthase subunit B [Clostridium sp.]|nr:F0F1 ATP synthase subunit B [Clostridium sp.]
MLKFDWNILWTVIDLIIFFVLMRVFLLKPIKNTIEKRRELISKQFEDAENAQQKADALKAEYQAELDGVEDEKKQIIASAKANAKAEYDKIINRAADDADKIKSDAKRAAELETEKARLAVREDIAKLAMETAAKVIGEKSSADMDSALYDKFLNESSDEA